MPISWKEMCRLFLEMGYTIVPGGGKGSHIKLKKDGCPTIIIPRHNQLTKKTEHTLRKALKLVKESLKL